MRAVVQRVTNADVKIDGRVNGKIDDGLLVLLGVGNGDTEEDMKVGIPAHTYGLFNGTTTTFSSDRTKLILTGITGIMKLEHILSIVD